MLYHLLKSSSSSSSSSFSSSSSSSMPSPPVPPLLPCSLKEDPLKNNEFLEFHAAHNTHWGQVNIHVLHIIVWYVILLWQNFSILTLVLLYKMHTSDGPLWPGPLCPWSDEPALSCSQYCLCAKNVDLETSFFLIQYLEQSQKYLTGSLGPIILFKEKMRRSSRDETAHILTTTGTSEKYKGSDKNSNCSNPGASTAQSALMYLESTTNSVF